jgi:hypothetical protein
MLLKQLDGRNKLESNEENRKLELFILQVDEESFFRRFTTAPLEDVGGEEVQESK